MIYDFIQRRSSYHFNAAIEKAFQFLLTLTPDTPAGRHDIDGDNIYANVMEYTTENAPVEKLEQHRRYLDIQYAISGVEVLVVTPGDNLTVHTPYSAEKDCGFMNPPADRDLIRLEMRPGAFALLFPQDAHMGKAASISAGPQLVKKAVVKVALDLF